MATAAGGALLMAGCCIRLDNPAPSNSKEISFSAGPALLQDGATKTGTLKTGTSFSTGDAFLAWAWHDAAHQFFSFGKTTPVTLESNGLWDYAPHQFWNWRGTGDFYDFLAVYPADADITPFQAYLGNSNLKASVDYEPVNDQYDLMAAGLRRTDGSMGPVSLSFEHALSAVSVELKNAEGSNVNGQPLSITLKSIKFLNIVSESTITAIFDGTSMSFQRPGLQNTLSAVLGPDVPTNPYPTVAPGYGFPSQRIIGSLTEWLQDKQDLTMDAADLANAIYQDQVWTLTDSEYSDWIAHENSGLSSAEALALREQIHLEQDWDLMIPQSLNAENQLPSLEIVYNKGDENDVRETLPLNEIKNQATNQPITVWNPGIKYHYEIELRIGVGIVVTVSTTPWEVVEAETPGLMI